jgi:hypothetical protein
MSILISNTNSRTRPSTKPTANGVAPDAFLPENIIPGSNADIGIRKQFQYRALELGKTPLEIHIPR